MKSSIPAAVFGFTLLAGMVAEANAASLERLRQFVRDTQPARTPFTPTVTVSPVEGAMSSVSARSANAVITARPAMALSL